MVSYSIDPALARLIAQQFPAEQSGGYFVPLSGLTGQTAKIELKSRVLLARHQRRQDPVPGVDRQREYRILRKLAGSDLGPAVYGYANPWLLIGWQPGEPLSAAEFVTRLRTLAERLSLLHRQRSGYPLHMQKLLEQYWQQSCADRRHCGWLRALRQLQRQGEPKPLRLALLHMDIHAGNLIRHGDQLQLIDWEYACDGDIALELAAIVAGNALDPAKQQQLTDYYADLQHMDADVLRHQIRRWQPWLNLLIYSWYELRWQQSGEIIFYTLAAEAWQRVRS